MKISHKINKINITERKNAARALLSLRAKGRVLSDIFYSIQKENTAAAQMGRYIVAGFSYKGCGYGKFNSLIAIGI